jgi:predicted amidophosphoribosyltransferase
MRTAKVIVADHLCPSCRIRMVESAYERCAGCNAKWLSVYKSCRAHGWPYDLAKQRADDMYHARYNS